MAAQERSRSNTMSLNLHRLSVSVLLASASVLAMESASAQTSGPVAPSAPTIAPPVPLRPAPPPTFQQRAYAHQTARTGSFVTRPGEAYLGVAVNSNPEVAAIVMSVAPASPADLAGIRPGDIITALGNHRTDTARDFNNILRAMSPGAVIDVGVRRGATTTTQVQLGYAPQGSGAAVTPIEQARLPALVR
jgi:S1-C subfamily serine protease